MDILNKEELGYIALFQSTIVLIGFLQTGIIYGGYRLISFSPDRKENANNAVMTYLLSLFIVMGIGFAILSFLLPINWFWGAGILVGISSLWNNWITNLHVGLGRTKLLSALMLASIMLSFLGIPVLYKFQIVGAVLIIAIQPITFIVLSYIYNRDFKFKLTFRSIPYIRICLKYGFVPFLTGILYYVNLQFERWIIGLDLGVKALGEYFLVFVYCSLFLVIPSALATINFPKMMKLLRNTKVKGFSFIKVFKLYYIELGAYLILMFIATFWILPLIVEILLPAHKGGIQYVKIVFWGLLPFTLVDPISILINAKLHYKELLYVYIFAVLISSGSYAYLYFNHLGSLKSYSYVNVIFFSSVSVGYLVYFLTNGRRK